MFRFNRLVCVVVICALAGFAYSKAVKSRDLIAAGLGGDVNPNVDGMIIMTHHDSVTPTTEVQIKATGLAPQTMYGVQVHPGFTDPFAFTTSATGNGAYHNTVSLGMDLTEYTVVKIFEWDGVPSNIDEITFQELRAYGCLSDSCMVVFCDTDADCDSGFDCLRDTCEGGMCFHERRDIDCDDADHCTADFCIGVDENGGTLCEHTPIYDPDQGCNPF